MPYFRLFFVMDDFGNLIRVLRSPYGIDLRPQD